MRRRDFLKLSAAAGSASLLVACFPDAAKPNPSASAAATPGKVGAYQLGKLEGPTIITNSAQFPKTFKEAPELAALVQQGRLPPLAQRIGQDPIVIKPVHEIGKYGGTMRKVFAQGVNDLSVARFMTGPAPLLFWDVEWKNIVPNMARSYELSADGKVITLQLRRGQKWSDGQPFTADDIMFWFEDIYNDESVHPGDSPDLLIGGKKVVIEKVDATTLRFVSPQSNPLLLEIMASPISDLGGHFRQHLGRGGPYAPKHYLQQFHAKYVGEAQANKLATDAKFNGWQAHIKAKMQYAANADLPVIYPWYVKTPATNPTSLVLERNPYSIWVDTEGNQLPYIGTVQHAAVENSEIIALRATAGELDFMELQFLPSQLPVLVQNEARSAYKVSLDPQQGGLGIALNLAYDEDAELGELYRNVDFRRALSMGIDRAQINEAFFLGTGTPSSAAPASENKYYPGDEWRTKWSTLDLTQANQLLDKIGLTQKDSAGYRLKKDGKRLQLAILAVDRLINQAGAAEMVKQQWQKIGVDLAIEAVSTNLSQERIMANKAQMTINNAGTDEVYLAQGFQTPTGGGFSAIMGVPYGLWFRTNGAQGKEPFAVVKQALDLLEKGKQAATAAERVTIGKELTRLAVDNVFAIGFVVGDLSLGIRIAKNNLGNVPGRTYATNVLLSPSGMMAQTYYFK